MHKYALIFLLFKGSESQFLPTKTKPIALRDSLILLDSESPEDFGSCCILTECKSTDELYENATGEQSTGIYENTVSQCTSQWQLVESEIILL